jgi:hypothetical protein
VVLPIVKVLDTRKDGFSRILQEFTLLGELKTDYGKSAEKLQYTDQANEENSQNNEQTY